MLARHHEVRALFDNGWLRLLSLEEGKVSARYAGGLKWQEIAVQPLEIAA